MPHAKSLNLFLLFMFTLAVPIAGGLTGCNEEEVQKAIDEITGDADEVTEPTEGTETADITAPETTIETGPSGITSATSAEFTFSCNESDCDFVCALDDETPSGCIGPVAYDDLSDGEHEFSVAAVDAAGNVDASPATTSWTVDTTVPPAPSPSFYSRWIASNGDYYIGDTNNHVVRKVTAATGIIDAFAGISNANYNGDGIPAIVAELNSPIFTTLGPDGNLYIADTQNMRIRMVDTTSGTITTVAGTGTDAYTGDGGPATQAALGRPAGVAVDADGNIYIADTRNYAVRRVDAQTNTITTVAGTGVSLADGDGKPATATTLHSVIDVVVTPDGDLYLTEGSRVRVVTAATGMIGTVMSGLDSPHGLTLDGNGILLVADAGEKQVFSYRLSDGKIGVIAGTGATGHGGDGGPATQATFSSPSDVEVAPDGSIYIIDESAHRVRRIDAATNTITTVVGTGSGGYSGDGGPATQATLRRPAGIGTTLE